jgi:hypothetical protein
MTSGNAVGRLVESEPPVLFAKSASNFSRLWLLLSVLSSSSDSS